MTGLDCLREEMEKRGLSKSQIESKTAAVVLDILAHSERKYTEMWQEEYDLTQRLHNIKRDIWNSEAELQRLKLKIAECELSLAQARTHKKHCEDYIDEFNASLNECETADGRDAMRTAQMFVNSVDIDTKYDNTAYIIGLASILSKGGLNAINELKKINKKIPDVAHSRLTI